MPILCSILRGVVDAPKYALDVVRSWPSTQALDRSQAQAGATMPAQTVDREQAVMHALLRSRDQIPVHRPCAQLRKQLFRQLEGAGQLGHRRSSMLDAVRMGALPACVAVALALGVSLVTFQMTSAPAAKTGVNTAGTTGAGKHGSELGLHGLGLHGLGLHGPAAGSSEFGDRPVRASDLSSPIAYPMTRVPSRETDDASMQSSPLMREANALQQAGPLIQKAILERLPPMPERPK